MIAYKVVATLDKAERQLRDEVREVICDSNRKERLLKVRDKVQEALTLLLGG